MPWNAPKRRKTARKITLAQLPASVKPEVKFSDRTLTTTNFVSQTLVRPDAFSTPQGDDGDGMIGSDVYLRSVDYAIALPTTGWNTARVSILIPRDPSISPSLLAPQSKYPHREFIVLYDEFFSINEKNHCRIKKVLNLKQKWNIAGSVLNENNVIVVCNTNASVLHSAAARTYYTDP